MTRRKVLICALLICLLSAPAIPQTRGRSVSEVYADVLIVLFVDVESKPYYVKFTLRFHDTETQLALIVYPGRESELVSHSLENMKGQELYALVSEMLDKNASAKAEEIAAKVRVRTTRFAVDYNAVEATLNELKSIKISPYFQTRIFLDDFSTYDYWFSSGQESVHYTICGKSSKSDAQDKLVRWMNEFREHSVNIVKHP
ncbi:MAG: hypothetical protein WCE52_00310 [Candidatus Acidiferrum sp.]